jgi:predicted small lipoprotein YifL
MKKTYLLILAAITLVATAGCIRESVAVQPPAKQNTAVDEAAPQSFSEKMKEAYESLKDKPIPEHIQAF